METYDIEREEANYDNIAENIMDKTQMVFQKTKDWVSSFLGVLTTLISVIVIFFVASLKGDIDILATLTQPTFWALTALSTITAIFCSYINYTSTISEAKKSANFLKTIGYYSKTKRKVTDYSQYIPEYCAYKNKQTFIEAKRNIVESADITWEFFNSEEYDYKKLPKWQRRKIRKIRRIKVKKITQADLLQEKSEDKTRVSILPISEDVSKKRFLTKTTIVRITTTFVSGFTMTMGIALGNWALGSTYALSIITASVMSAIQAFNYVNTSLKNRYIAKADLLNEFYNIKEQFIKKES